MQKPNILEILNRLQFFSAFTAHEKKLILSYNAQFRVFKPNDAIIQMGTRDTDLFILLAGQVKVTLQDTANPISTLTPGEIFGEMSFLTQEPRATNVIATTNVITLKIDNDMLATLPSDIREKIKDRVIEKLIARIRAMNERLASQAVIERIA